MKVSIIIPLYNKEKFILFLLRRLEENKFDKFEVLVIDDKSTDTSLEIVKKFQKKTKLNIRILENKENKGVSFSRNVGIENSKGEYLIFLDADDYIITNGLDLLINVIENEDIILLKRLYKRKNKQYPNKYILMNNTLSIRKNFYIIKNIWKSLEKKVFLGGSASYLIKKEILGEVRFKESEFIFEDYLFTFEVLKKCKQIYYYDKKIIEINDYGESLSRRKRNLKDIRIPLFLLNLDNKKILSKQQAIFFYAMYRSLEVNERYKFLDEYKNIIKNLDINKYSIALWINAARDYIYKKGK